MMHTGAPLPATGLRRIGARGSRYPRPGIHHPRLGHPSPAPGASITRAPGHPSPAPRAAATHAPGSRHPRPCRRPRPDPRCAALPVRGAGGGGRRFQDPRSGAPGGGGRRFQDPRPGAPGVSAAGSRPPGREGQGVSAAGSRTPGPGRRGRKPWFRSRRRFF